MKILELTNYSAGICGVWQRAKQESIELSKKGHEVRVFSSNFTKGSDEVAEPESSLGNIKIFRFPAKKLGGESFIEWNFETAALDFSPDVIIAHSYRHLHTTKALKIAKKLKQKGKTCRVFLVTHAPFIEKNSTRSFLSKIIVNLYDSLIARTYLNKFDKVIAITKWEYPFLEKIGCRKDKIVYIPNGIPEEFFKSSPKKGKNVLFLGRISPVKDLEVLIKAIKDINLNLDIVGPAEKQYLERLNKLIIKENIKNVRFLPPVYDLREKISIIDKYEIFVLPSKTEAMPQSLIESMARGKICISSKTRGGKEIIQDNKNGFLFEIGDDMDLSELLKRIIKSPEKEKINIIKNAVKTSEKFRWSSLIKDLDSLITKGE